MKKAGYKIVFNLYFKGVFKMSHSIQVLRKTDYNTRLWSGGTTNELLIYPTKAIYGKDYFQWRLSSAKIDLDESTFTILPNIKRIIIE